VYAGRLTASPLAVAVEYAAGAPVAVGFEPYTGTGRRFVAVAAYVGPTTGVALLAATAEDEAGALAAAELGKRAAELAGTTTGAVDELPDCAARGGVSTVSAGGTQGEWTDPGQRQR
jgi:hypothetical protein